MLRLLLKSSGIDLAQIEDSFGEEQFLSCKHIASIRFPCGRDVKYVLTKVDDNSVIIGSWFESLYGKRHLKKTVRNFFVALSWPASEVKSAREVHQQERHSYLTTDFKHILLRPPPLKRWTWEKPAHLCSSCERLVDRC